MVMIAIPWELELHWRNCRVCHGYSHDKELVMIAVRHYAHPECLVGKYGRKEARTKVRWDSERTKFDQILRGRKK